MNIESTKEKFLNNDGFERNIGMEFFSTPENNTCMAKMHVDERNIQPFGFLSGGAMISLAETLSGVGSVTLTGGKKCLGMNVHATHMHAAPKGDTVTAIATIIHQGKTTHVWHVDIYNQKKVLVSTISVTNYILDN